MYAKKNKKPMYGKGGAIKYQNGGQGPDLFGIDAVLEAREKAKNDPNYDPLGLKELVPAAKERISNQMKEAGDSFEDKREAVLNYLVDLFNPSSEKKMKNGGMMPRKYENGGPIKRSSSVDFGNDAVGDILGGRASAANPNDMDLIREVMTRAFNESKFGGENKGRPYRLLDSKSYDSPFFYNEGDQSSRSDALSDVYEASGRQGTGMQGDYSGPYQVMIDALSKLEGVNENQRTKANKLAFDMANALYPSGF